jgi:hypothetical protein
MHRNCPIEISIAFNPLILGQAEVGTNAQNSENRLPATEEISAGRRSPWGRACAGNDAR